MVYAKQTKDGKVIAILTYSYTPQLSPDSGTEIITEEEYNELWKLRKPILTDNTDKISDREALSIILGGGGTTDEA